MRRLFASLVCLSLMSPAFAYDDDRYTYTPPRVQDYQNQYKPQNNYSPSFQLDRQVSNMNSVLTFKQNVGYATPKIDLKIDQIPQDTFKPKILFQLAMANPVKAPIQDAKPLQPITVGKPGFLGAVQSIFKGIGAGFQKVGQAIGNVLQRVFTRTDKPGAISPQQKEILAQYPNLQPTGPNSFVAVGKATVAFGKVWEPGSTFTAKDGNLQLNQGVSLESSFGGIKDKNGGLLPVRMTTVDGNITAVGLDFDRMRANTTLLVSQPTRVDGFGTIHPGEMTYQGPVKDAANTTVGGRFNFQGVKVDLEQDAARQFGVDPRVTLKQATFALQAGLMRLNSALLEQGDKRIFIQESKPPLDVSRLPEDLDALSGASQKNATALHNAEKDFSIRTQAINAQISRLAPGEDSSQPFRFDLSGDFSDIAKSAADAAQSLETARSLAENGDYHSANSLVSEATARQAVLSEKVAALEGQSKTLRAIEHALSNVVQSKGDAPISPAELAARIQIEISKEAQPADLSNKHFIPIEIVPQTPVANSSDASTDTPGLIGGFVRGIRNIIHGFIDAVKLPIHLGQRAALFLGKVVDHTGRTARRTQQFAAGAVFGVLSGDIFDSPGLIVFDKQGPPLVTINGIWNDVDSANVILKAAKSAFGIEEATMIINDTHYWRIGDIVQILGHETLGALDKPAIQAAIAIREGIKQKGIVYVIAHSQGSAIFRRSLDLLTAEEKSKIHYLGLGPEWNITSDIDGLGSARNVWNKADFVPILGNWLALPLNLLPWRVGRIFSRDVVAAQKDGPRSAHIFNNYKSALRTWASEVYFKNAQ